MMPREQKIKEIEAQYPDEWVLIQVTRSDRYGRTTHGTVIAHGPDENKESLIDQELSFHQANPHSITYLHWTGRLIPEGLGVVL